MRVTYLMLKIKFIANFFKNDRSADKLYLYS